MEEMVESDVPNTGLSIGMNYFVIVMGIALVSIYTGIKNNRLVIRVKYIIKCIAILKFIIYLKNGDSYID